MPFTPEKVQELISSLEYEDVPWSVTINSAESTLRKGSGNCLEIALVAALLMEPLGFPPKLLEVSLPGECHAMYYYQTSEGYSVMERNEDFALNGKSFKDFRFLLYCYELARRERPHHMEGYKKQDEEDVARVGSFAVGWHLDPKPVDLLEYDRRHPEKDWRRAKDELYEGYFHRNCLMAPARKKDAYLFSPPPFIIWPSIEALIDGGKV